MKTPEQFVEEHGADRWSEDAIVAIRDRDAEVRAAALREAAVVAVRTARYSKADAEVCDEIAVAIIALAAPASTPKPPTKGNAMGSLSCSCSFPRVKCPDCDTPCAACELARHLRAIASTPKPPHGDSAAATWISVERNAAEVATWPEWKRRGSGLLPTPGPAPKPQESAECDGSGWIRQAEMTEARGGISMPCRGCPACRGTGDAP